ncbi:MAG TPA: SDR family oxidoreductase [Terriglobales bacterium]
MTIAALKRCATQNLGFNFKMAIFLTGATGYIGAHVAANLLERHDATLNLLVRGRDPHDAEVRLWSALQLHMPFSRFYEYLQAKIRIFLGDLTSPQFGLDRDGYDRLVHTTDSVIHCAASLNRKSEKSCLNVNLRGTLEVIQLARRSQYYHGLRRFSNVSTVAVAGKRRHEVVTEDRSIEWERSDYDPYSRTKKFCEHMVRELLPDVPLTIFRPSIVLGDSRYPETTQFDMVRSFVFLAGLPVLPFRPHDKIDIVNVDFVADAISTLHMKPDPQYDTYHLSSGNDSQTFQELTKALAAEQNTRGPLFMPVLEGSFSSVVNALAIGKGRAGQGAALLKVFLPYLVWNTVFDNTRVTTELGKKPAPFSQYSFPLLRFSRQHNFQYPYREWPTSTRAGGSAA